MDNISLVSVVADNVTVQDLPPDNVTIEEFGAQGLSAYALAVADGFVGTVTEWLASLKGEPGDVVGAAVFSVAGRVGDVVLAKTDVGLANVDNTSDVDKPVSDATQTALNTLDSNLSYEITSRINGDDNLQAQIDSIGGGAWGDITGTLSNQTDLQAALDLKVDKVTGKGLSTEDYTTAEKSKLAGIASGANVGVVPNAAITGATKTKITYDTKGLVTSGADATTADIADSTNKRYVTDANLTTIGNQSGTNTGDETGARVAALNHAATNKSALVDADEITGQDSAASFSLIRTTWTQVKAFLKTYFDTLYQATLGYTPENVANKATDFTTLNNTLYPTTSATDTQFEYKNRAVNSLTADYTLVLADANKKIRVNSASPVNVTVPLNSSVAFPIGARIPVRTIGTGSLTIVAAGGVTINAPNNVLSTSVQYSELWLWKEAADTWSLQSLTNALARANHTGTQTASTISDFNAAALLAAPAETTTTEGALISGATAKTTPVDADYVGLMDSAASNILKKLSWANIKATLNSVYQAVLVSGTNIKTVNGATLLGSGNIGAGYTLQFTSINNSPADATTYYFGSSSNAQALNTSAGANRIYIPQTGTLNAAYLFIHVQGTAASSETSTISIRLNNTTDYTISSAVTASAGSGQQGFSNAAMAVPVTAGDYIEVKWVTPTWATNPTNLRLSATFLIQ